MMTSCPNGGTRVSIKSQAAACTILCNLFPMTIDICTNMEKIRIEGSSRVTSPRCEEGQTPQTPFIGKPRRAPPSLGEAINLTPIYDTRGVENKYVLTQSIWRLMFIDHGATIEASFEVWGCREPMSWCFLYFYQCNVIYIHTRLSINVM